MEKQKCCYCGNTKNIDLYYSLPHGGVYVCSDKEVGSCRPKKLSVIVNVNLEIPTDANTYEEAIEEAMNYELPKEYVEDSLELIKAIDEDGNEFYN